MRSADGIPSLELALKVNPYHNHFAIELRKSLAMYFGKQNYEFSFSGLLRNVNLLITLEGLFNDYLIPNIKFGYVREFRSILNYCLREWNNSAPLFRV